MPNEYSKETGVALTAAGEVDAKLATPLPVATPDSVGFCAERLNRLDGAMQAEIDAGHYAGISVMVARHGKLVKFRRYGYQALGASEPLREDAIYRIASMTKPIIAVAMLLLYEEGKWQLDDPVTHFIPEFADLQVLQDGKLMPLDRPMTMRHLMASSAGFAFGPGLGTTNPEVDDMYAAAGLWSGTNDEIIPKLAKLPLESQPGTEFRYGLQQEVQGAILRRITGEQLDTLLERLKLMTTNLLPAGVPMHFTQPFTGVGYGMNVGIVLDPSHADFNGGANGAGTFYWGGVHGTWFWVDPANDIVVVGMIQQQDGGNAMTGRPYPVADVRGISRSITYGALVDPAL
jgi:CubicO group peptidase (beta-lactamase class C family)